MLRGNFADLLAGQLNDVGSRNANNPIGTNAKAKEKARTKKKKKKKKKKKTGNGLRDLDGYAPPAQPTKTVNFVPLLVRVAKAEASFRPGKTQLVLMVKL